MNIGILGTGSIAKTMARTIERLANPEIKIHAVASRGMEKAESFAARFHIPVAYSSYADLVKDQKVDLVYVATPHSCHYENALLALQGGKNVLVEKPLCLNKKQAEILFSLAREKSLLLREAFWTRYTPASHYLHETLLQDRVLGDIKSIDISFGLFLMHVDRLKDPNLAGGALLDLGVYPLSFALNLIKDLHVVDVKAKFLDTGVDAEDRVILSNGRQDVTIHLSMNSYLPGKAIIRCVHGKAIVKGMNRHRSIRWIFDSGRKRTIRFKDLVNGYEYQFLKMNAMLKGNMECDDMKTTASLAILALLDDIRKKIGLSYPNEKP